MYFRAFINVYNRVAATGFQKQAKQVDQNFFFSRWSNQTGKIFLAEIQITSCPALEITPGSCYKLDKNTMWTVITYFVLMLMTAWRVMCLSEIALDSSFPQTGRHYQTY